jgi:crotonobetainyl-CoA:carnitine CoA-transferase CaiB-like acyl-CoA transferase
VFDHRQEIHQGQANLLSGIRVLDLSRVLAGPWCSQLLADLGATVLKIERAGNGDDTRRWGPPWYTPEIASYYTCTNRGKYSIAADFNDADQLAQVKALAERADVVIENFKVGSLRGYGLDAGSLRTANPRLVYCSISGFGQNGPMADQAGYDFALQGFTGLMQITGEPGREPQKVGVAVIDLFTGLYATNAITAALLRRSRSGEGATIDCSLLDSGLALLANQAAGYLVSGQSPKPLGNAHPSIVPYQTYATRDGFLVLAVGNDSQFSALAQALQKPHWSSDPRFATNPARVAHRDLLNAELGPLLETQSRAHWIALLGPLGVPCTPVQSVAEVFAEPQVAARALSVPLEGATGCPGLKTVGQPMVIDGLRPAHPLAPGPLGPSLSICSPDQIPF